MKVDRRDFIWQLGGLALCGCPIYRAVGKTMKFGCRSATQGGGASQVRVMISSGITDITDIDRNVYEWGDELRTRFGLNPIIGFYDDSDGPNALAMQDVIKVGCEPLELVPDPSCMNVGPGPRGAPQLQSLDGTVLLGVGLLADAVALPRIPVVPGAQSAITGWGGPMAAVMAHEFGHILQYKNGMRADGPWQMEPHADFMAGWALGGLHPIPAHFNEAIRTMFNLGDWEFNAVPDHGKPEFRATMIRSGSEAWKLSVREAYEAARSAANLN
jgi:hypothetical protein